MPVFQKFGVPLKGSIRDTGVTEAKDRSTSQSTFGPPIPGNPQV